MSLTEDKYLPIHKKPDMPLSFDRLDMLWEKYPRYHERTIFSSIDKLLEEHESYQEDFAELQQEYKENQYESFLVQLSWSDLAYRYATKRMIETSAPFSVNPYVEISGAGKVVQSDTPLEFRYME